MRKVLALSVVALMAAAGLSTNARAESGDWYAVFQRDACRKMPTQMGCMNFEQEAPAAKMAPATKKAPAAHKTRK